MRIHTVSLQAAGRTLLVWALLLILVSACASSSTPPPPTATSTVVPTRTSEPKPAATLPEPTPTTAAQAVTATPTPSPPPPPPTATVPPTPTPEPVARYRLTFDAMWSADTHPLEFPSNPHFSGLIGATHTDAVHVWAEGALASPGIKSMAETGSKKPLDREIETLITQGSACVTISSRGIGVSPGAVAVEFEASVDCPFVSVVTMIAPSPDWFVGVDTLSLLQESRWVGERVVDLVPYDAGTDSGESYASRNAPTGDPVAIYRSTEPPLLIDGVVPSFGTFTFTRLDN